MPRFDTPIITNDFSVDRVLNSGLPVALLIENGSQNASLEELLRQVAKNDAGRVLVVKLNAAENPQTAAKWNAPAGALITFRDGREVSRANAVSSSSFREHVSYLLGRGPKPAEPSAPPPQQTATSGQSHSAGSASAQSAPAHPVTVTDSSFKQEVLQSDLPVLVDLWAAWCGPCRMIAPVVEKMAKDYAGRLKVAKLNVDENPLTAMNFQVQGIPTLLIFKGGKLVDRIVGAAPEPMLRGRVDAALR